MVDEMLAQLREELRFLGRGRSASRAAWQLAKRLREVGWTVKLNKVERQIDGSYFRAMRAAIEVSYPRLMAIEIGKSHPGHKQIERLVKTPGVKVMVLMWSRCYEPWTDSRIEINRVQWRELDQLDYILASGGRDPVQHTPAELRMAEAEARHLAAERERQAELDRERGRVELASKIMELARQGWAAWQPVGLDGRLPPTRNLVQLLPGMDTKQITKQLIECGELEIKRHPCSRLIGLHPRQVGGP
jgi:hypothetical protein